jgi:hypothetical protein
VVKSVVSFDRIRKFGGLIIAVFMGLAAVIGTIYGFGVYIDSRVKRHVSSDAFLKRLAAAASTIRSKSTNGMDAVWGLCPRAGG